jgi:tetratricopeptide (TPR) repeat protein
MKKVLFVTSAFAVALLLAFRNREKKKTFAKENNNITSRVKTVIRCTPDWNELKEWLEEASIPPMPGAGTYKWKISTVNDSAQFYFNQGINMYYGFHIIEAMASFKKAVKFDPNCAMLYWAQALGYGPNINDFGYRASPEALAALNRAKELAAGSSGFEKGLIDAMGVRYTADSSDATRAQLNRDYTSEMKKVFETFPGNADAMALYADAMMLEHPWNLWNIDGTPKEWTPRIREVLEKLLAQYPDHPGGNHYYIHVMEPSPYANRALPSAERLGITNPGLAHLVHMPSHIYLRTGRYQQGVDVNSSAVNSFKIYSTLFSPAGGNDFLYAIHNLHMKTNNAMLAGNYATSLKAAAETKASIPDDYLKIPPPMGNYIQYIYSTPVLVYVRFGKWDELMKLSPPDKTHTFSGIMYHFGRGMALADQMKLTDAKKELLSLQELMKDTTLNIPFTPYSAAIESAAVGENILVGTIALKERRYSDAIVAFEEAAVTEETMVYNEPRDWMLNPKHYLGHAYLRAGRTKEAKETFEKDLLNNNENGWALYGLWQSLQMQKKTAYAARVMSRYRKAFARADVKISGPVF